MNVMRRLKTVKKSWVRNQIKPLAAWRAMRELLRNPDDTTQVFHIIEALKGDSLAMPSDAFKPVIAAGPCCRKTVYRTGPE